MEKLSKAFALVLFVIISRFVSAQGVDAYFYYSPFYAPNQGSYIETYIAIAGNSVNYLLNEDSTLQASVEITMVFKNVDDVKEFRKYKILSPPLPDTTGVFPSFIDLQRIAIPEGVYNFDLIVHDNYGADTIPNFKMSDIVSVNMPENEIALSGIQLLEAFKEKENDNIFVKSGYECIPYVSDFYPEEVDYLRFYVELYNAAKELGPLEDFLFLVKIEQQNTQKALRDFSSFMKEKALNVNVFLKEINISTLPSGNYYLVIEIRDRSNKLVLSKRRFFQRSKPVQEPIVEVIEVEAVEIASTFAESFVNIDSLKFALHSLQPISDPVEAQFIENQLGASELKLMQQFFYSFWQKRNQFDPEGAWNDYYEKVRYVQQQYGTKLKPGFLTDRGRIYLQYGVPNSIITENNESGAYPYEIWHYYKVADQTNVKLIFYNRDLYGKDFSLLDSNLRGEVQNVNWETELYSRTSGAVKTGKARQLYYGE